MDKISLAVPTWGQLHDSVPGIVVLQEAQDYSWHKKTAPAFLIFLSQSSGSQDKAQGALALVH
jgi:hypothetical protein